MEMTEIGRTFSTYGTIKKYVRSVLMKGPEGKRPLGRRRRKWEDKIKMDLKEVGCNDRNLVDLVQDRDQWRAW